LDHGIFGAMLNVPNYLIRHCFYMVKIFSPIAAWVNKALLLGRIWQNCLDRDAVGMARRLRFCDSSGKDNKKQAASGVMHRAWNNRNWLAVGLCLALPCAALAEQPTDFTFKRLKVGSGLPGKRITVQIDPAEQARLLAALPVVQPRPEAAAVGPVAPAAPAGAKYDWFWEVVPTQVDQASGRFPLAMASLSQGPGGASVTAPRMQHMQEIAQTYGTEILKATIGTQVSPALVLAVIGIESAGKPDAVSSAGAQGLMQLIPATASRFGVVDSSDPAQNIKGGVAYLDWLMTNFDRDPVMVIAAYNAGEGAVAANAGVPPYAETRDYVPKVLAAWQVAQGLCQTPPELVTDPCVFKVIAAGG
jgi:Transglycosylase SLT domain